MKNDRLSLSQRAYNEFVVRILDGRLRNGDVIDRKTLAQEMGMSIAPLNEALAHLASEGLVEILPRRGTRVRPVSIELLREQLLLRCALESQVARLCCGALVRENFEDLRTLCLRVDEAEGAVALWQAETAFHMALANLAACSLLADSLRRVLLFSHFAASQIVIPGDDPHYKHLPLLEALRTDDPEQAASAVRSHLSVGREAVLRSGTSRTSILM